MAHELPALPYAFEALEPHIDARTMEIHHDKHHAAYVMNLNKALDGHAALQQKSITELLSDLSAVPEAIPPRLRRAYWRKALLFDDQLVGRHAEHIGPLHRQAEPIIELIPHYHFPPLEPRSLHGVAGQMRRGVGDALFVLVRWDAELHWPRQLHGLIQLQKWIHEHHFTLLECRRARRLLGIVQLEMLEGRGRRGRR